MPLPRVARRLATLRLCAVAPSGRKVRARYGDQPLRASVPPAVHGRCWNLRLRGGTATWARTHYLCLAPVASHRIASHHTPLRLISQEPSPALPAHVPTSDSPRLTARLKAAATHLPSPHARHTHVPCCAASPTYRGPRHDPSSKHIVVPERLDRGKLRRDHPRSARTAIYSSPSRRVQAAVSAK